MAPSLKLIELMLPRAQKQALVGGCHAIILTLHVFGATTFDFWLDITICFRKKTNKPWNNSFGVNALPKSE